MKALDTNVLARAVLNDDAPQSEAAVAQLREPCFAPDTVLMELAWLLSARYHMDRVAIARTLRDLITLPTLSVADFSLVEWAIGRFEAGADFADMLHIANAGPAGAFVSFEKGLARKAGPGAPVVVERLTA